MRYLIIALLAFNFLVLGSDVLASESNYKVSFKLPQPQQWQLESNTKDAEGYTQIYASTNDETLTINYGKGITTSLKNSMQQVLDGIALSNCQRHGSKVITQKKNELVFTTFLDQCQNGKTLKQIYKVFNMPDGQYSISYTTAANTTSSKQIQKMEAIVKTAKIVPNN